MLREKARIIRLYGRIAIDAILGLFTGTISIIAFIGGNIIKYSPRMLPLKLLIDNDNVEKDTEEYLDITKFFFDDINDTLYEIKILKNQIQVKKDENNQLSIKTKTIKKKVNKDIIDFAESLIERTKDFSNTEKKVIILKIKEILLNHTDKDLTMKKLHVIENAINEIIEAKKKEPSILEESQILSMITPPEKEPEQDTKNKKLIK